MAADSPSDCLKTLHALVCDLSFKQQPPDPSVPIIFVPGFSGWGAPLLGSLNYWGGVQDIPKLLLNKGHTVIVSSIAPLSSNWERACELYRELTCGKFIHFDAEDKDIHKGYDLDISYGDYFSQYPGQGPDKTETTKRKRAILFANDKAKYENWKWSKENKAHFICHSQGGTTVRQLISLMARGESRHPDYFGKADRDDWAISVTTLGTPHKGTTICDVVPKLLSASSTVSDKAIVLLGRLFAALAYKAPALQVYDLQLDHWGIGRHENESFQDMRARLEKKDGPVRKWAFSKHNAFYDNSIEGVEGLRKRTTGPSAHIYYFTLSFHSTVPFPMEYPDWAPQAAEKFPFSLLEFAHAFLQQVPVFGAITDRLLGVGGWVIFKTSVKLGALSFWVTTEVVEKLLAGFGYSLTLPAPGKYLPRRDVIPLMLPTVYAMGGTNLSDAEIKILGDNPGDWYLNDGIVNTASMSAPLGAEVREIAGFLKSHLAKGGSGARGRYWHFGVNDQMDHADEIGVWIDENTASSMVQMYGDLAELVSRLKGEEVQAGTAIAAT